MSVLGMKKKNFRFLDAGGSEGNSTFPLALEHSGKGWCASKLKRRCPLTAREGFCQADPWGHLGKKPQGPIEF